MSGELTVGVKQLPHAEGLDLPRCHSENASGVDVPAAVEEPLRIEPGQRVLVPTGLVLVLPPGVEGQVRPRSGLAWKHGVTVLNGPGTIDADYRGEVKVLLINLGQEDFIVQRGDRVAQLVFQRVLRVRWELKADLEETPRGAGGFGHTGHHASGGPGG